MPRRNQGPHLVFVRDRGTYYISWTENGRNRRRGTGTDDIELAQKQLQKFLASRPGRVAPRDPDDFPIVTALEDYGREHAPTTLAPERIAWAFDALIQFWDGLVISDITRETCKAYVRERDRAPATVRRELGILRAAINHEVREGRLTRAVTVFLPPKPEPRDRWMTPNEVAALLRESRRSRRSRLHLPLFILIGLYTGARKEAILSLRWPQVDLELGRINFNPPGRPRTSKGRPTIPIPRRLLWFLHKARQRGHPTGYVINEHGRPIKDVRIGFTNAAIRAGLCNPVIDEKGNPVLDKHGRPRFRANVSPHTLRHTAGTWMAQKGVPLWEIAGYLGHSDARTAELYSHHHPDHLKRAVEAFN